MTMNPVFENASTGGRRIHTIHGQINTTAPTVLTGGADFSVSRTAGGDVTITFTVPYAELTHFSVTTATAAGATLLTAKVVTGYTGAAVRVQLVNQTPTLTDGIFFFEAHGYLDPF